MLVLKPLDQAIRDGDPVRAVIAGTGINQDGKTPGITMPNGEAQGESVPVPLDGRCAFTNGRNRGPHEAGVR